MKQLMTMVLAVCCSYTAMCNHEDLDAEADGCVIDLECEECLPDNMPLVTSHNASGQLRLAHDEAVVLWCGSGRFLLENRAMLQVRCSRGHFRLPDGSSRHLLDLGCQQDVIEDVLHPVEHCGGELQGRVYRVAASSGSTEHLAELCFDADRALPLRAHVVPGAPLPLPPHQEARAPLSLFGNFNEMFDARNRRDAERLFSDDARLHRRVLERLRHERVALGEQTLTTAPLLAPAYFRAQEARAARLASNRVVAWRSVARGNWRHLQRDVRALARRRPGLHVHAGTHAPGALRAAARVPLAAGAAGRFPLPRYLWTVVHEPRSGRALALLVLNEPLLAVSEVRGAVFCESACARAAWLHELLRQRRYETPALGLTFCCLVHDVAALIQFPQEILKNVSRGLDGALFDV